MADFRFGAVIQFLLQGGNVLQQASSGVSTLQAQLVTLSGTQQQAGNAAQTLTGSTGQATQSLAQMEAQTHRVNRALGLISNSMLIAGGAIIAGFGEGAKKAEEFQIAMSNIAGNTDMTTGQMNQMAATVKRVAQSTGADLGQLGEAYMHISSLFGSGDLAGNAKILEAATKSALGTGGNVGATGNVLAQTLKEFGMGADRASHAMDVLQLAAAHGNITLQSLVDGGAKAIGMGGALGLSLEEVAANLSALTEHGFPSGSAATTQFVGMLSHIIKPTAEARKEIEEISRTTGVNLSADFSLAGVRAKGLSGVIEDVSRATHGNEDAVLRLIGAQRGGIGALTLSSVGAKDYADRLKELKGITDDNSPSARAFAREQETAKAQMDKLRAAVDVLAIDLGNTFLPAINTAVRGLTTFANFVDGLPKPVRDLGAALILGAGALLLIGGMAMKMVIFVREFSEALAVLRGVQIGTTAAGAITGIGTAATGATGPVVGLGAALASAGLAAAWIVVVTAALVALGVDAKLISDTLNAKKDASSDDTRTTMMNQETREFYYKRGIKTVTENGVVKPVGPGSEAYTNPQPGAAPGEEAPAPAAAPTDQFGVPLPDENDVNLQAAGGFRPGAHGESRAPGSRGRAREEAPGQQAPIQHTITTTINVTGMGHAETHQAIRAVVQQSHEEIQRQIQETARARDTSVIHGG